MGDAMTGYNETGRFAVPPARLAELIGLVAGNVLSLQAAKKVFASPELADPSAGSTRPSRSDSGSRR